MPLAKYVLPKNCIKEVNFFPEKVYIYTQVIQNLWRFLLCNTKYDILYTMNYTVEVYGQMLFGYQRFHSKIKKKIWADYPLNSQWISTSVWNFIVSAQKWTYPIQADVFKICQQIYLCTKHKGYPFSEPTVDVQHQRESFCTSFMMSGWHFYHLLFSSFTFSHVLQPPEMPCCATGIIVEITCRCRALAHPCPDSLRMVAVLVIQIFHL